MKVTGFTSRSLAERDEISFSFSSDLSNVTGSGVFGFSGDAGTSQFLFKEGKIYDPENRYFNSYHSGENFTISGNISGSKYSYYSNEQPAVFVGSGSAGKIKLFYLDVTGCEMNAEVRVKSKPFKYVTSFPSTYRAGDELTGYISGKDSNYNFKIFSGEVTSPNYWVLTGFDSSETNNAQIKLQNTGSNSGINNLFYDLNFVLYTNLGNLEKNITVTSTAEVADGGTIMTVEDVTASSGEAVFTRTGTFSSINSGTVELDYQIYDEEVEVVSKPIKISLDDINTSGNLNGYGITGLQLQGSKKNGMYTGVPSVIISSTGEKDVQATATALTGEFMCADLYTGGMPASPLWDLAVKFYTITGLQVDSSGAYEDPTSISVSFSGGQYTGANFVGAYWYNGPSSETQNDSNCAGARNYFYASGGYSNIIDSHIKQHATGVVPLTTTGEVFSRTLLDTWNILTGETPEDSENSNLISFNNTEPWNALITGGTLSGLNITQTDKTSGNSYYNSGTTDKSKIKIEVWNKSAYRPISDSTARIITNDEFYTYNYNPLVASTGGNPQWSELKDLVTGTLLTGGTGEITFSYSFIESGTTRDNLYTKFKTLEDTDNSVSFSQFTGEIVDSFNEWKGLFETVFTGLTLNFTNNGLETGKVLWSDRVDTPYALPHPSDSKIGDIRIGKVLLNDADSISSLYIANTGSVLGQSGNFGGDIVLNSNNKKFRLDTDTTSTSDSYSIKYLFCQQIGKMLGVHETDHGDSILYNPQDGTNSLYTTWSFSDYFANGLSGSKPDQDAVRYSYAGTNHSTLESSKLLDQPTQELYSATLNISGSGSYSVSQIITGGAS